MNLSDRVARLEQDRPAVTQAQFVAAVHAAEARLRAKLRGDELLPPEPPEWFLAEFNRRVTPADVEEANAKLLRLLERKAAK